MADEDMGADGTPLSRLECVPIDVLYIGRVMEILSKHGASAIETKDCTTPTLFGACKGHKEFTIIFPQGTLRQNGLVMQRSVPFIIVFPGGYRLHAAELWPLFCREDDRAITVLYLPQEA